MKFKKRHIAIPIVLLLLVWAFFNLQTFLSPYRPVKDAKILVVDGWLTDDEFTQAVEIYKKGNYSHVLVPGGIMERSLFFPGMKYVCDVSAVVLMYKGMPHDKITPLIVRKVKRDRTYQSALTVQLWMKKHKIKASVNLFTSSAHARRSWLLYKKAFNSETSVGIIGSQPVKYNADKWWKTSEGFRTVISEFVAYLYARLFFHPDL
jgi:hypothetical protein